MEADAGPLVRPTGAGGGPGVACSLKALKGFLILKGEETVWGHSVGDLAERAAAFDRSFEPLLDQARSLDVYYIPTRYPNGLPGGIPAKAFGVEDSGRALEKADRLIGAVNSIFEQEAPDQPPGS